MIKLKNILILIILLFSFIGCIPIEIPETTPAVISPVIPDHSFTKTPFIETSPPDISETEPLESPTPTSSIPDPMALPHYSLSVYFDIGTQTAIIDQKINFTNPISKNLDEIILSCDLLRYPDAFNLTEFSVNNINFEPELGDFWIKLRLNEPLLPHDDLEIDLKYTLQLPAIPPAADDKKPMVFGYTVLQSNFVDWYPMLVPLSESGDWQLHDPWFYGEYLVYDLADFEVDIQVAPTDLNPVIAASSLPFSQSDLQYKFVHNKARNFVWSISSSFLSTRETTDGITITSYYFPFHQNAGQQVALETKKAIQIYSKLFGAYPRKSLTIVEADFLDGMEYDGLYFLSRGFYNLYDGSPKGYLTMIAVHETAHQWWYTLVANDQAMEPWLDESLSTYSELLFYENAYPDLINWWWSYRVNFYNPQGLINQPIYEYHGFVPYRDAAYLRGAQFFQALRDRLGDQTFFSFLNSYEQKFSDKISSENDFWQLLNEISNNDLSDIRKDFFLEVNN